MDAHAWSTQSIREGSFNSACMACPVNFMALQVASTAQYSSQAQISHVACMGREVRGCLFVILKIGQTSLVLCYQTLLHQ